MSLSRFLNRVSVAARGSSIFCHEDASVNIRDLALVSREFPAFCEEAIGEFLSASKMKFKIIGGQKKQEGRNGTIKTGHGGNV